MAFAGRSETVSDSLQYQSYTMLINVSSNQTIVHGNIYQRQQTERQIQNFLYEKCQITSIIPN